VLEPRRARSLERFRWNPAARRVYRSRSMPKRHRVGLSAASVLRHVEEVVLATCGEDAFEIVFAVAAARLASGERAPLRRAIDRAVARHPLLDVRPPATAPDELLARVDRLLARALADESTLDAVFESLVPRVAKSDKGQFFTPRHVVEFVVRMLGPSRRDVVVDPACGSGAFLSAARASGAKAFGCDVDGRAVRVARLLALASGADPRAVERGDGLRGAALPRADVVATNPPFAGRTDPSGFDVARVVRTPERDVLFLERALALLRPGGRLGIVLPYNKASGAPFAGLRRWLVSHARVLAIVGLPRETFLPHTSQRTFVLFARKRGDREAPKTDERTMFVVSERAGKDAGGEPMFAGERLDHDLDEVGQAVRVFLTSEGFA
jgi:type I restriction enzyme M protein